MEIEVGKKKGEKEVDVEVSFQSLVVVAKIAVEVKEVKSCRRQVYILHQPSLLNKRWNVLNS